MAPSLVDSAISYEALLYFAARFTASSPELNTKEVVEKFVLPQTKLHGSSYARQLTSREVSTPTFLVSHNTQAKFSLILDGLQHHLQGADPAEVFLWIDVFSVGCMAHGAACVPAACVPTRVAWCRPALVRAGRGGRTDAGLCCPLAGRTQDDPAHGQDGHRTTPWVTHHVTGLRCTPHTAGLVGALARSSPRPSLPHCPGRAGTLAGRAVDSDKRVPAASCMPQVLLGLNLPSLALPAPPSILHPAPAVEPAGVSAEGAAGDPVGVTVEQAPTPRLLPGARVCVDPHIALAVSSYNRLFAAVHAASHPHSSCGAS